MRSLRRRMRTEPNYNEEEKLAQVLDQSVVEVSADETYNRAVRESLALAEESEFEEERRLLGEAKPLRPRDTRS